MSTVDRVLRSPWFWASRAGTTTLTLFLVWRYYMSDFICYTPVEIVPYLMVIGMVVVAGLTALMGLTHRNDTEKKKGVALGYSLDYLSAHVAFIIFGIFVVIVGPGAIYDALGAEPVLSGCILMGLVIAVIMGIGGEALGSMIVDYFRDQKAKKKTE